MRAHIRRPEETPPPWPWEIARWCLELPGGSVRHFPAGSYHAQTQTAAGRKELELMDVVYQAWHTFAYLPDKAHWQDGQLRFYQWLEEEDAPAEARAHEAAGTLIHALWSLNGG
jgi:hypothetical protein